MSIATGLLILLVLLGFSLSLWILIPAPIFSLLPLSVGVPEISPWLAIVNATALFLSLSRKGFPSSSLLSAKALGIGLVLLSAIALALSLSPLMRFPQTQQQAEQAIAQTLGPDYLEQIDPEIRNQLRSHPLNLLDNFRGIPIPAVRETLGIPFAQPDGVPLTLNLYRPEPPGSESTGCDSAERYPALITLYGGAWQRGTPESDETFNRYIAAQGYAVWALSYRHAPDYHFPAQLEDVRSALTFIKAHGLKYETDLNRVAVMGRSAGSQLSMLAAYQPGPLPIRAVVDYYGPVDLTAGYNNIPKPDPIESRSVLEAFLGGSPHEFPELYHQASPINTVKPGLPPSLLIYGERDHVVKAEYGQALAAQLRQAGNPVVFIQIPWADHAFDAVFRGLSNQLALYYTERFLAWTLHPATPGAQTQLLKGGNSGPV